MIFFISAPSDDSYILRLASYFSIASLNLPARQVFPLPLPVFQPLPLFQDALVSPPVTSLRRLPLSLFFSNIFTGGQAPRPPRTFLSPVTACRYPRVLILEFSPHHSGIRRRGVAWEINLAAVPRCVGLFSFSCSVPRGGCRGNYRRYSRFFSLLPPSRRQSAPSSWPVYRGLLSFLVLPPQQPPQAKFWRPAPAGISGLWLRRSQAPF